MFHFERKINLPKQDSDIFSQVEVFLEINTFNCIDYVN